MKRIRKGCETPKIERGGTYVKISWENGGNRRRVMCRWHDFTVFVVGRVVGLRALMHERETLTIAHVGASFCSPLEEKVDIIRGFATAHGRGLGSRYFEILVPLGMTLDRAFRKHLHGLSARELSRKGVPDRLIEKIHDLPYRSFQTKRPEDKAAKVARVLKQGS